jgi:hypothetical protein
MLKFYFKLSFSLASPLLNVIQSGVETEVNINNKYDI